MVQTLRALGAAMVDADAGAASSRVPPVYTYWGQFVDHDLTANTDRDTSVMTSSTTRWCRRTPDRVRHDLRNLRQPALNLDSLYGNGPGAAPAGDR